MKIHNEKQGSQEWLDLRTGYFAASDASAMMGESKHKSRNQLLHEKKTGRRKETSDFVQNNIFDKGHEDEESARKILEMEMLECLTPKVCSIEIEGLKLIASLDGMNEAKSVVFEHKQWNAILPENVRNGVLAPDHYWQLEQQLLVTGAAHVLFVVSDGSIKKWVEMEYHSNPDRRKHLIAGWKQFAIDLEAYVPLARQEEVVGVDAEDFPKITYKIQGTMVVSNIAAVLPIIRDRADQEMSRILDSDQDFADKEKLNKATKVAREKLKEMVARARGEFVSFSKFSEVAEEIGAILQKMQSNGERQVKQAKTEKKIDIVNAITSSLRDHIIECDEKISQLTECDGGKMAPFVISQVMDINPDWHESIKGKRNLETMQSAVDNVLANTKVKIDRVMSRIIPNQIFLRAHAVKYAFLFNDVAQIINHEIEPFQAIVRARIYNHEKEEEDKLIAEREKIRKEEELKAKKKAEAIITEERRKLAQDERDRVKKKVDAARKLDNEERERVKKEQEQIQIDQEADQQPREDETPTEPTGAARDTPPVSVEPADPDSVGAYREILTLSMELVNWTIKFNILEDAAGELAELLGRHGIIT